MCGVYLLPAALIALGYASLRQRQQQQQSPSGYYPHTEKTAVFLLFVCGLLFVFVCIRFPLSTKTFLLSTIVLVHAATSVHRLLLLCCYVAICLYKYVECMCHCCNSGVTTSSTTGIM